MVCTLLALHGPSLFFKEQVACAVQLVRLGAEVEKKLTLPPAPCDTQIEAMRTAGLDGKTARELAILSEKRELINAIKELKDNDARIA
jgi:hypothetical protein